MVEAESATSDTTSWGSLVADFSRAIRDDRDWAGRLVKLDHREIGLHLAVFIEPYLSYVMQGRKTVESRFSQRRYPPYGRVSQGDLVLIKKSGGPIVGVCEIGDVWYYQLDPDSWAELRNSFTTALCAQDPAFWEARAAASFATLMRVTAVQPLNPIVCTKRDRRGWIVIRPSERDEESM